MPSGSTRPRSTRPRRRARSRCSERSTGTWSAWSKWGTTRASCAAGRTSTGRATSSLIRILHEGSIGAGMRRVEALVGPDALREINAERALLRGLVETLGSTDPASAIDRARQLLERVKRLETELGKIRQGDVDSRVDRIAEQATEWRASDWSPTLEDVDPDELRALAQKVVGTSSRETARRPSSWARQRREGDDRRRVQQATVERGVTAPELLEDAAKQIGGGAGGKDRSWRSLAGRTAAR